MMVRFLERSHVSVITRVATCCRELPCCWPRYAVRITCSSKMIKVSLELREEVLYSVLDNTFIQNSIATSPRTDS